MDFWNVLGSFGGKKRKRNDDICSNRTAAPLITSVFPKPPVKVNESLYKVDNPLSTPTMEVLFFHGLQFGDPTESHFWTTWESRDRSCIWPEKWLGEDFPGAKIMFVSYDGDVTRRTSSSSDLYIIIENLITDLLQDGIGQMQNCPLIMVGHCFGGVVIKKLCLGIQEKISLTKSETERLKLRNFLDNIKGIFYYDTPHHGISGLDKATAVKNDPFLTFFQILSRDTGRLNFEFSHLRGSYKWQIDGLGASLPTKLSNLLVAESSGREGADHYNVVGNVDHNEICKPRDVSSRSFYALKDFVNKIATENAQLLAGRVAAHNLLEGSGGQMLALLPFNSDHNYVPIEKSILEIQRALEDEEGQRVITLYGGPGLGKSGVVKYLALHHQEERKRWLTDTQKKTPTFPGGVYYLHCGQEAQCRIQQIQLELIELLGYGAASAVRPTELCAPAVQGESFQIASVQRRLQCHSVEQQSLIILDDVWEQDVVERLLVHAQTVKYLITSQYKGIWAPSKKIKMKSPTMSEARQIMATYTEGLPTNGEFPYSIQNVTDAIIRKVDHHPLSLAYIGISISSSRATDARPWQAIEHNIQASLDESDVQGSPVMYNRRYSLTVSASMLLMVDSLRTEARRLLFLIALLGGGRYLPVSLVRFFHKFLPTDQKYYLEEKYLEDRSLIELHTRGHEDKALGAHSLTIHCIREKKTREVLAIASQILPSSNQLLELMKRGDSEEILVIVLSAMYFTQPFKDIVVKDLESHLQTMNGGIIPWNINNGVKALQLAQKRGYLFEFVPFITAVDGEQEWERKAHAYGRKIIIKLAFEGKLHDYSMAGLLQIPETCSTACQALSSITHFLTVKECPKFSSMTFFLILTNTFSSTHPETMEALLALVLDNATSTTRQVAAIYPLLYILKFEKKDTILKVGTKWTEVLAMDSNPVLQIALINCILEYMTGFKAAIAIRECTNICEVIFELLLYGKDNEVQVCAGEALQHFCLSKFNALEIAIIPDALAKLFNLFFSNDTLSHTAGILLVRISCALEKSELQAMKRGLEGLGHILAKVKGTWQAADNQEDRKKLARQAVKAAQILGDLALDKEMKKTIVSLSGVKEGLLFLQTIELTRWNRWDRLFEYCDRHDDYLIPVMSTRALVLLYSNILDPRSRGVLHIEELEVLDEARKTRVVNAYVRVYWTKVLAYFDMGDYRAAVESLDLAQRHLNEIPYEDTRSIRYVLISCPWTKNSSSSYSVIEASRRIRKVLCAMLKDPEALLFAANMKLDKYPEDTEDTYVLKMRGSVLLERGIAKRLCGDLQGALDDLNLAMSVPMNWRTVDERYDDEYFILKHRGYVKHLMEDEAGAREDAEDAQLVMHKNDRADQTQTIFDRFSCLDPRPLNYLGYSLR